MKKTLVILFSLMSMTMFAQGQFDVIEVDGGKVHVYQTNDTMNDASIIVEGSNGLITMEPPLFKSANDEFNAYIEKLGKPVIRTIFDYHLGGTNIVNPTFPEGMIAYMGDEVYDNMMKGFQNRYGDQIVDLPALSGEDIAFGSTQQWAGVNFTFNKTIFGGMPGADILIAGKVFYTHSLPAKAHAGARAVRSAADIDKQIAIASQLENIGVTNLVGSHGGLQTENPAAFMKAYYTTMKQALTESPNAEAFVTTMKQAYPGLQGEEGLTQVAQNLYK